MTDEIVRYITLSASDMQIGVDAENGLVLFKFPQLEEFGLAPGVALTVKLTPNETRTFAEKLPRLALLAEQARRPN